MNAKGASILAQSWRMGLNEHESFCNWLNPRGPMTRSESSLTTQLVCGGATTDFRTAARICTAVLLGREQELNQPATSGQFLIQ